MDFFSFKNIIDTFGLFYVNDYPFLVMVWNLFLAFFPFFFFLAFKGYWRKNKFSLSRQKIFAGLIFFLWLIFLPNSAYLIVVGRHLFDYCPADSLNSVCISGAWQIMFFFCYSVLGWVLFVISLKQMAGFLAKLFSKKLARWFVAIIIPLVSLGVLLGLTGRFNSWDIFRAPLAIFQNLLKCLTDWQYLRNFLIFSAGYYLLYFFGDYLFKNKGDMKF
jgi:uncharacterized membrane protein